MRYKRLMNWQRSLIKIGIRIKCVKKISQSVVTEDVVFLQQKVDRERKREDDDIDLYS